MRKLASVLIAFIAVLAAAAATPLTARRGAFGLDAYPDAFAACGGKATALFQKCRPQAEVLARATAQAKAQNKAVLIEVGADWCGSCIVMDHYLNGNFVRGAEPPGAGTAEDAVALARFMAANFVVARLDADDPTIDAALRPLGLRNDKSQGPAQLLRRPWRQGAARAHRVRRAERRDPLARLQPPGHPVAFPRRPAGRAAISALSALTRSFPTAPPAARNAP